MYVDAEDDRFPLLHDVLIRAARLPGSKLEVMPSTKELVSVYKAHKQKFGARSKPWLHARMPLPANEEEAGKIEADHIYKQTSSQSHSRRQGGSQSHGRHQGGSQSR